MKKPMLEKKMDGNGNKIVVIRDDNGKSFSVQTNKNLPKTHRYDVVTSTFDELAEILIEIKVFVTKYGTTRQQNIIENVLLSRGITV